MQRENVARGINGFATHSLLEVRVEEKSRKPFSLLLCRSNINKIEQGKKRLQVWLDKMPLKTGGESPSRAQIRGNFAWLCLKQQNFAVAEEHLRKCLAIPVDERNPKQKLYSREIWMMLGLACLGQQKDAEAKPLLQSAYNEILQLDGMMSWPFTFYQRRFLKESLESLIQLYDKTGQKHESDLWRERLKEAKEKWRTTAP